MEPRIDPDSVTEDAYHSILTQALNNAKELLSLVDGDIYAETLIKAYGQLLEIESSKVNGCAFEDLLAMDIENGIDPDILDRSDRRTLVEFQIEQAREAIVTYLKNKMNASFSGVFTVSDRCNYYDKANSLWNSFEDNEAKHMIFEDNIETLIMFVNKSK